MVGVGVGLYAGIVALVPLLAALVCTYVAQRFLGADRRFMVPALAVQAGHLVWFLAGVLFTGAADKSVLLDVAALTVGLLWLIAAPGFAPIVALAIFQAFATWVNAEALLAAPWASIHHKALLVHLALRFLALTFLGHAALVLYARRRV